MLQYVKVETHMLNCRLVQSIEQTKYNVGQVRGLAFGG